MVQRKTLPLGLLGLIFSIFSLWCSASYISFSDLVEALLRVNVLEALAGSSFLLLGLVLSSYRWRYLLGFESAPIRAFFYANVAGLTLNYLLPFRLGEGLRLLVLSRMVSTGIVKIFGSGVIDRFTDFLQLGVVLLILISLLPRYLRLQDLFQFFTYFILVSLVLVSLLACLKWKWLLRIFERDGMIVGLKERALKLLPTLSGIRNGLLSSLNRIQSFKLFILCLIIIIFDALAIWALLFALEVHEPWFVALVLWASFALGSLLPAAPGYIGVYQVAAIWGLSMFDIGEPVAIAVATLYQVVIFVTLIILHSGILLSAGPRYLRHVFSGGFWLR